MDESDEELKTQMEYILRIGGLDETAFEVAYEDYLILCERMHVVPMLFDHNVYVFQMDLNKNEQENWWFKNRHGVDLEKIKVPREQVGDESEMFGIGYWPSPPRFLVDDQVEGWKPGLAREVLSLQDDQIQNQVEDGKPGLDGEDDQFQNQVVEDGKPGLDGEVLYLQDDQFQNQVEEDGKPGLDGEVLSLQDDQFQNQVESRKPGLDEEVLSLQEEQHEAETKNSLQLISENYGDTTETKNSLHIISESYVDSEGDEPS